MSIAFFDVDGTLLPHPSLERRFFWNLARRGEIPVANYFHWATQMLRPSFTNFAAAAQSNKMYLRGVSSSVPSAADSREYRRWVPEFFPGAIQRIWWHTLRGEVIVLVTGTLAPLAEIVKSALERELLSRGIETQISVFATQLVTHQQHWTGSVNGALMFGDAKAAAVKEFAITRSIPLSKCFAYGDHALDGPTLQAVGRPFAVNPTSHLRRIAQRNGWPMLHWSPCPRRTAATRHALKWKGEVAR